MGQLSKKCQARGGLFSVTVGEKKHQNIYFLIIGNIFFKKNLILPFVADCAKNL